MVQKDSLNKPVIVVCGPTASGKTALAVKLAKMLGSAIINADSIAVYKDLYIGTAKPSESEREGIKHYLLDCIDADKDFTVAEYSALARAACDEIHSQNKVPIICGGTGYYINSVLYDFSYGNCPKDDAIREKYDKLAKEKGVAYVHSLLKEVDPESYMTLHENDLVRVIRALEIYELTGTKKSDITDEKTPVYNFVAFSFDYERSVLYDRINRRVDKMIADGLIEEVKRLLDGGLDKNCQSMQAIGYKEVVEGLENGYSVNEIAELIKRNTRRYAKRQITFFKKLDNTYTLDPYNYNEGQMIGILKNGHIIC